MVWHDCKTDPPKKDGWYLLIIRFNNDLDWDRAYYNKKKQEWQDFHDWSYYKNFCYKWAEVELPE